MSAVTFMTSRVGHAAAVALGVIGVTWREFAPFYRHMKRLHGGAYVRMLVSGQRHTAMDVLQVGSRAATICSDIVLEPCVSVRVYSKAD